MQKIVYVNVLGGPPFDYVIPRLQELGEVHVVQPEMLSDVEKARLLSLVDQVFFVYARPTQEDFRHLLVDYAKQIDADVLLTFDEFYLKEVAEAALWLGLKGPGPAVSRSINKVEMYRVLERYDLLKRDFCVATDVQELMAAPVKPPYVIKPSQCAGSLGVFSVQEELAPRTMAEKIQQARASVHKIIENMPWKGYLQEQPFIKEGLLVGDATTWFGSNSPYADYISVEGMILHGHYYPLAITQNCPLLYPFIETVSLSPTTLPLEVQLQIVNRLRPCLESIGLDTCGTHTEIKLLAGQDIAVIETAARFAGGGLIPQIEAVFGINAIRELVVSLLEDAPAFNTAMDEIYQRRHRCTATITLLPVTASGQPWEETIFRRTPDFSRVIDGTSQCIFTPYIDIGEAIRPFSIYDGAWNGFGKAFLVAQDMSTLNTDIRRIRASLRDLIQ